MKDITHIMYYDTKDKKYLYYTSAIRLFFWWLINIFIPWLIYQQTWSILDFFIYLLITSITIIFFDVFIVHHLLNHWWTKILMLIWLPFLILYYYIIYNLQYNPNLIYIAGIILGIFTSFFWTAFHVDIAQASKGNKKFWEKVAILYIVTTIVWAIAPLIWWYFLDHWMQKMLLIIASIWIILSGIPIILSAKKHKTYVRHNKTKLFKYLKEHLFSSLGKTLIAKWYVLNFISSYYWPLFVYIFFWNFSKLWIITAMSTIITVILIYITGKLLDKKEDHKLMKITVSSQFIIRISAFAAFLSSIVNTFFLYAIDILQRFIWNINNTCIVKNIYDVSWNSNENSINAIILNEISIHWTRIIFLTLFLLIFYIFDINWKSKFILYLPIFIMILMIPLQYSFFKSNKKQ